MFALLALLVATGASAAEPVLAGDKAHGARLFRLHCAGCHGDARAGQDPAPIGKSLGAARLRDPALLAARNDDDLIVTMLKGGPGPGSPAFGRVLSLLDAADLVALLRASLPTVSDVFPDAAAATAKRYTLQGPALNRVESLAGAELPAAQRELTVFTVYGGGRPPLGPRLVPQDPVQLDTLSPKLRRGWVVFSELPGAKGEPLFYAMGLGPDFTVSKLAAGPGLELSKVAPAVIGKGGREPGKRKPFLSKAAPEQARALTQLYARAVEAAAIAAKEEADRHLFDAPESTARGSAAKQNP